MVAGETSGDLLAAVVLKGLRARHPQWRVAGIGGPAMGKHGFSAWWPSEKLSVRGYVEVLRHYREIVGIRDGLQRRLLAQPPRLFMGVDAPDFNLKLEHALKSRGVPVVHFVCPSIWAWRPERIEQLKASTDHVLCIFPFEPALLAEAGIHATYVGHPLAPLIPMEPDQRSARAALGLSADSPVVALLPGSRASEVKYLLPRFLATVALILKQKPAMQFVLPALPALRCEIDRLIGSSGLADAITVVNGQSHAALAACDVTLIASGTATLEAALFKRPMVIAYNMHCLSWLIMRRKKMQPWVGLPNILCRDFVVPELLQDRATPAALSAEVLAWFEAPERVADVKQRFTDLHHTLMRDTVGLACDVIDTLMTPAASADALPHASA
ncbi:MAG: lipid-A-disaccharide synthase [Burkholderiales bacterium]|nr:lipid-A-disaccharide synthase [Burkholderiales bacterium]